MSSHSFKGGAKRWTLPDRGDGRPLSVLQWCATAANTSVVPFFSGVKQRNANINVLEISPFYFGSNFDSVNIILYILFIFILYVTQLKFYFPHRGDLFVAGQPHSQAGSPEGPQSPVGILSSSISPTERLSYSRLPPEPVSTLKTKKKYPPPRIENIYLKKQ